MLNRCPPGFPKLETRLFAHIPFPGHPLGVVAGHGVVYVGTHRKVTGEPHAPSHVYSFDKRGDITDDWQITGQADSGQGIAGMVLDHEGVLYIVDQAPSRIITLDPKTGEQELYARLPGVPLCRDAVDGVCSPASADRPAQPINLCFGPDGSLYVGDLTQALVWRVPRGGGTAEVWYSAPDLDSLFGPNTVRMIDGGRTMLLGVSAHGLLDPADLMQARGRIYALDITEDGRPGERRLLWEGSRDGDTPDGFVVGESGNIYVALAIGSQLLVLDREGREVVRVPQTEQDNSERNIPFDLPGGVAFLRKKVLVTNQVFLGGPSERQVVFSVDVHEREMKPFRPRVRR